MKELQIYEDMFMKKKSFFFLFLIFILLIYYVSQEHDIKRINTNAQIRMYLTMALVEHGTTQCDKPWQKYGFSLDRANYNGNIYCDKAPGISFIAVPFYFILFILSSIFKFQFNLSFLNFYLRFFVITIPTLYMLWLFYKWLLRILDSSLYAAFIIIGYALGSMALLFSTTFFAHQFVGIILFFSFYLIYHYGVWNPKKGYIFLSGLLAGLAVISEYPAGIIVGLLGLYFLFKTPEKKYIFYFIAGIIPFVILHAVYTKITFGSYFVLPYFFTEGYRISRGITEANYINWPTFNSLIHTLFTPYRGLFFGSPVIILALIGIIKNLRNQKEKMTSYLLVLIFLVYTFFINTLSEWEGGGSTGARHFVVILPFLFFGLVYYVKYYILPRTKYNIIGKSLFLGSIVYSILYFAVINSSYIFTWPDIYNPVVSCCIPILIIGKGSLSFLTRLFALNIHVSFFIYMVLSLGLVLFYTIKIIKNSSSQKKIIFYILVIVFVFISINIFSPESKSLKTVLNLANFNHYLIKCHEKANIYYLQAFQKEPQIKKKINIGWHIVYHYVNYGNKTTEASSFYQKSIKPLYKDLKEKYSLAFQIDGYNYDWQDRNPVFIDKKKSSSTNTHSDIDRIYALKLKKSLYLMLTTKKKIKNINDVLKYYYVFYMVLFDVNDDQNPDYQVSFSKYYIWGMDLTKEGGKKNLKNALQLNNKAFQECYDCVELYLPLEFIPEKYHSNIKIQCQSFYQRKKANPPSDWVSLK